MRLRDIASSPVREVLASVAREVSSDLPANAIYANGEPIPDPAGGGYLTYEV